ncbi:MAG: T9SS type A sorting domain-containing protein [Bacteroidota bacterium]
MKNKPTTKLLLIAFSFILKLNIVFAQSPFIEWQKAFGGTSVESVSCIQQTIDGGFITSGNTYSNNGDVTGNHGSSDCWIVKMDTARNIQWQKSFGGSSIDQPACIRQTSDSGYIFAGYTLSNNGDVSGNHSVNHSDFWIVKTNSAGTLQWQKCVGGTSNETAKSIEQTSDGGYIVAGFTASTDGDVTFNHGGTINLSDYWLVKLDASGNIQWQKTFGGSKDDIAYSVTQTTDGGYVIAGISESNDGDASGNHGLHDYWIVKTDGSGNIQWQKSYGGSLNDYAYSIQQTSDGGYIVAGGALSNDDNVTGLHGDNYDCWIVRLNSSGTLLWQKTLGGTGFDQANAIIQATDGGFVIAGENDSNDGDVTGTHGIIGSTRDAWVVKLNTSGVITWKQSLGGGGGEAAHFLQKTTDGKYVVACSTSSNNGDVTGNHGNSDYWIIKLSIDCTIPGAPSPITVQGGSGKVCSGDTRIYTTALVAGVSYNWTVPAGAAITSGQGTNSIHVIYNNFTAQGTVGVVKVNSCGSSIWRSVTVLKGTNTVPSAITGPAFGLCGGRNIIYTVQAVAGNTYNWTVPGLAHIVSGQGTNTIKVNFQSVNFIKTISVKAINGCGASAARTLLIRSAPQKPGIINGAITVCPNSTVPYSITPVALAVNYTWMGPAGSTITANGITSSNNTLTTTATGVTINFALVPSNASVRVKANNKCASSALSILQITPCSNNFSCTTTIDIDNTECYPNCMGVATVHVTGGTPPYSYNWSKPSGEFYQDTQTATGLCGGTYTVIVFDNNGNTSTCEATLSGGREFTLPDLSDVDLMFSGYCSPFCNGYINVNPDPGPQSNYTYLWNTGQTTALITGLCGYSDEDPAGFYTVHVTDAGGCTQEQTYFMENHISFLAFNCETTSDESSPGAADGEIETTIVHGGGPFTYQWSNGQTGSTASNLTAGTYTVTVTDASLCTATSSCVVNTISPRKGQSFIAKQITAKPNPFAGMLNMDVTTDEPLTISVKDIAGKIIHIYNNISSSFVMDDQLKSGVYFIHVENQSGTYKKVMKVVRTD